MPMTNPGGGGGNISTAGDASISPGIGIDQFQLVYNFALAKWVAQAGGIPNAGLVTGDPNNKSAGMSLSNGNLTFTSSASAGTYGAFCTAPKTSGKRYFEVKLQQFETSGLTYTGIALASSSQGLTASMGAANNNSISYDSHSWNIVYGGSNQGTIGQPAANDIICVAVDISNALCWMRRNAGNWNNNASANPATGAQGINISTLVKQLKNSSVAVYPFVQMSVGSASDILVANFGSSAFAQTVPNGFSAWDEFAVLPETVGASPATITAPSNGMFLVEGGTISSLSYSRDGVNSFALPTTQVQVVAMAGDQLTVTYSAAPTVSFAPF
jgi:hypothetical protein